MDSNSEDRAESTEDILSIVKMYSQLFTNLDCYFSLLRTKRFHTTVGMEHKLDKTTQHFVDIWRYFKISVTPKVHIGDDHIVDFFLCLKEFDDITEDEGEPNY